MKKDKYSKGELKARRTLRNLTILVSIVLLLCILFFVFVVFKDRVIYEKIDYSSKEVSDDIVKNSTPFILNNVILGATYKNTWIAPESYFFRGKKDVQDIDIYNELGKKGKFNITEYVNADSSGSFYVKTNTPSPYQEFVAIPTSDKNVMLQPAVKEPNVNEDDIKNVKKAIGMYRIFNNTVKISSVHHIVMNMNNKGTIICATNEVGKSTGAYSAVVFVSNDGDVKLLKYNYSKKPSKEPDWPIYSFKFVIDLNNDGKNEIILQETKEFSIKYDVIENRNGNFVEVVSTEIKSN